MNRHLHYLIFFSIANFCAVSITRSQSRDSLDALTGLYKMSLDSSQLFRVGRTGNKLILEVVGQGQTELLFQGGNRYRPNQVNPPAIMEFIRDSTNQAYKFTWLQDRKGAVTTFSKTDKISAETHTGYAGTYAVKGSSGSKLVVEEDHDQLLVRINNGSQIRFLPVGKDRFAIHIGGYTVHYEFAHDRHGGINKLLATEEGVMDFFKAVQSPESMMVAEHLPGEGNSFTRADTLRGMLTPVRTCYDVVFYGLDLKIFPDAKSLSGSAEIRFKAIDTFSTMQVDLYANMKIDRIVYNGQALKFSRELNAVFVKFPSLINKGSISAITIFYSGTPQTVNPQAMRGGFIWFQDKAGNPWIESVSQGSGASVWWPCKDHQSDKPDSMSISIAVPNGLMDISNGRLLSAVPQDDGFTKFNWYVDYPIVNYGVAVNIGKYEHSTDVYRRQGDTMALKYYYMPDSKSKAATVFAQVKGMLDLYETYFGTYPFTKDGFTLMESLYPMEHQGAVTFGPVFSPVNSDEWDSAELRRTAWHESAHEWWGNSITSKDIADLWIHEAFATYAEVLAYEHFSGKAAASKYLQDQHPENKFPIISTYGVNDFELNDVYSKGCLMLNTIRHVIDDDSLWFAIMKGLQDQFKYQSVNTEDIVSYFNKASDKNLTSVFDQYLRYAKPPELDLVVMKNGTGLTVKYKWTTDVKSFGMPVKITTSKNEFAFIHPTNDWQTIRIENMDANEFKVDEEDFYMNVKRQ